ncbi:hypothetical protein ACFYXC_20820 [Streptomyces sp. NPDC002701]|uniref:hypothetical protein n=1 Tax=Streptomyces sp. NPDC002701 TaxID=3364661 RepID=UPI0036BF0359
MLAPQGVGDHVDHLLTARAVAAVAPAPRTGWWRDLPYAARTPRADTGSRHGGREGTGEVTVGIDTVLPVKTAAAECYTTQLAFQFGDGQHIGEALSAIARAEARRTGSPHPQGETLRAGRLARRVLEEPIRSL